MGDSYEEFKRKSDEDLQKINVKTKEISELQKDLHILELEQTQKRLTVTVIALLFIAVISLILKGIEHTTGKGVDSGWPVVLGGVIVVVVVIVNKYVINNKDEITRYKDKIELLEFKKSSSVHRWYKDIENLDITGDIGVKDTQNT